ncbi:MAG: hypothetical protein JRK53_15895 [Deltaproteobacteria bacterium]|nr:hypothetical protein [Deltaproteobacteria bacterium]
MPEIVKRVQNGDQYTVLYRSRPVFRIIGVSPEEDIKCSLTEDPLYLAEPVGASSDGLDAADHDSVLYGH